MELNNIKKILVINLGGIGDLLLSQPALRALRQQYKGAVIDVLLVERAARLVGDYRIFDNIFIFRKNIFALSGLLLKLRKNKYDLAINMRTMLSWQSALKMFFVFKFISPKASMGRDTQNRGFFFDLKVPEKDLGEKYEMEYDIDTVNALGIYLKDKKIEFAPDQEAQNNIDGILSGCGVSGADIVIGIHPGGMPSRRWPIENFGEVMRQVSAKFDCKFIITGSREEGYLAKRLAGVSGAKVIDLSGRLNTQELLFLIKRCRVFISCDTGPMHMAAALGIPQIALFGPGDITRFDPRNISGKAIVFYNRTACAPCSKFKCASLKCLKMIKPEEVVNACFSLLKA
ncbi:MAG: glycosyltransferase family 9 protein [Candidatus Omnitrophica bacterium]|nr:glycosyltransferase family 9 protein [Candidatus Omnitrophota bacterium]